MVFSSAIFLYFFLPLFLGAYYLCPKSLKSLVIALGSYVFYGWWRPDFVFLMLFSTVLDYYCGKAIASEQEKGGKGKRWLWLSMVANLGLLGYFKYANFGIETANAILERFGFETISWTKIILPVGISFYTFQTMSYTIDVYRRAAKPVSRFRDFMCYVALFPQLVAGPIVRYNSIAEQLRERRHTFAKFFQGVLLFQIGFSKKLLIADVIGNFADQAFAGHQLSALDSWAGILAYAFQIYFDFSGYSDMAIGLGLMLGFRFPVNFDAPYRSASITEFWRRWHISLSSWLRDYLYIPLGGNRRGPIRTYVNLALTMLLGGLWHGASWTFIAWGGYQGFWLIVERLMGKDSFYRRAPRLIRIALTFVLVLIGWVFFRSPDIQSALHYFAMMFGQVEIGPPLDLRPIHLLALIVGAVVIWTLPTSQRLAARASPVVALGMQPVFLVAILHLHYQSHVPFLYYQF